MRSRRFPLWIVLGLVLVVALVIGSGVFTSKPPTPAQRAQAIEADIKCPSCEDLSVADSSAATAVTVRATVRQLIGEGKSDRQIEDYLVARYGTSIVLLPPASGWSLLVWVLPLAGGVVAIGALATVFVRKRRAAYEDPDAAIAADAAADADAGSDELHQRQRFLEQSLADAFAEHRAGDLSDGDYQALRRRDTARLAALDVRLDVRLVAAETPAELAPGEAAPAGPTSAKGPPAKAPSAKAPSAKAARPKRPRRQRVLIGGAVTAFGMALVLLVVLFAANRLPGQTETGSVALTQQEQTERTLEQAATDENDNQSGLAAQLYQQVLDQSPTNEVALAQLGWLEYETGHQGSSASLISDARAKLTRAVKLDPGDYAARLYLGTLLLDQDHDAVGAVAQYQQFMKDDPPAALLEQAASTLRQAYQQAGVPVPSQVPTA